MQYVSILLVFLLSLVLGMGCAVEVERFQEGDLEVLYNGLHCLNADGEHGELVQRSSAGGAVPLRVCRCSPPTWTRLPSPPPWKVSGGQLNLEEFSVAPGRWR